MTDTSSIQSAQNFSDVERAHDESRNELLLDYKRGDIDEIALCSGLDDLFKARIQRRVDIDLAEREARLMRDAKQARIQLEHNQSKTDKVSAMRAKIRGSKPLNTQDYETLRLEVAALGIEIEPHDYALLYLELAFVPISIELQHIPGKPKHSASVF